MVHTVCSEALSWVVTQVHLNGIEFGVMETGMQCGISSHFSVCHNTISIAQKDHLRLRGYLTPRNVQIVTLPSPLALSLCKNQSFSWHEM